MIDIPQFIETPAAPAPALQGDRHRCPWPGCSRVVANQHWGCIEHYNRLPRDLQIEFRRTDSVEWKRNLALEAIDRWISANAHLEPASVAPVRVAPPLTPVALAPATPNLTATFASGITADGEIFLFWPRTGEYMVLSPAEARLVARTVPLLEAE